MRPTLVGCGQDVLQRGHKLHEVIAQLVHRQSDLSLFIEQAEVTAEDGDESWSRRTPERQCILQPIDVRNIGTWPPATSFTAGAVPR